MSDAGKRAVFVNCEGCGAILNQEDASWTLDGEPFHFECIPKTAAPFRVDLTPPDTRDALIKSLVAALAMAKNVINHCDVTDGTCCCGEDMETHSSPMSCGHSPVDYGSYQAEKALEQVLAALRKAEEAGYGAE